MSNKTARYFAEYAAENLDSSYHDSDDCGCGGPSAAELVQAMASVAPAWQPIETAPKDMTKVLVLGVWRDGGGYFWDVAHCDFMGNWEAMGEAAMWTLDYDVEVTHWMPLPAPPQDFHDS
jgi:hypothetical protein